MKEIFMRTILCCMAAVVVMAAQLFAAEPQKNNSKAEAQMTTQKKALVVCYSRTGNTKKVAEDIAAAINADVEVLIDKKDRSGMMGFLKSGKDASQEKLADIEVVKFDPAKYEMVILGTPIWAGNMAPALRTYITNNKQSFKSISAFTTSGGTKPAKTIEKIETLAGKKSVSTSGFFAGEIKSKDPKAYQEKLQAFLKGLQYY
jgi:flavodoxin